MLRQYEHPAYVAGLDINLQALPVELDPAAALVPLSGGFNSRAYQVGSYAGEQVIKVSKQPRSISHVDGLLRVMRDEYSLLEDHLGVYVPKTEYHMVPSKESPKRAMAVIVQPYADGQLISEYLAGPDPDIDALAKFFGDALHMHERTGKIADLANVQERFRPETNTNVVVTNKIGSIVPVLTDTNFGRAQRMKVVGPRLTERIAVGVRDFLDRLESDQL